jgi:hypothetical protein
VQAQHDAAKTGYGSASEANSRPTRPAKTGDTARPHDECDAHACKADAHACEAEAELAGIRERDGDLLVRVTRGVGPLTDDRPADSRERDEPTNEQHPCGCPHGGPDLYRVGSGQSGGRKCCGNSVRTSWNSFAQEDLTGLSQRPPGPVRAQERQAIRGSGCRGPAPRAAAASALADARSALNSTVEDVCLAQRWNRGSP